MRLSLSCSTFVKLGSVLRMCSSVSLLFYDSQKCFAVCSLPCYRFLSSSFVSVSLRMVHVPFECGPSQTLDRGSSIFCCKGLDIFCVYWLFSVSNHLLFQMLLWNSSSSLISLIDVAIWRFLRRERASAKKCGRKHRRS